MGQSKSVTLVLTIWVLVQSLFVSGGVNRLLAGLEIGGLKLPLGGMVIVVPIAVAVLCFRRLKGARIVASLVLLWTGFGAARIVIMRLLGTWPYEYTTSGQLFTLLWFAVNAAGLVYLWAGKKGNPYARE